MNTQSIPTAILSYGMSGEIFHAPLLEAHAGFELKKIWQRNSDSAKQRYPRVDVVTTLTEILNDPLIELVVVNTPNETHLDFATQALEAGKHVVVEKPFTPTARDAAQLISLAKKNNRILTVFQNRRWDGGFCTIRKVIEWGMIGKLVEYEVHYDRFRNFVTPNTWKEEPAPGSGILFNLGSHILDQVVLMFGMPKTISAVVGIQRPEGKVEDFYDLRLQYKDINVIVKSSYLVREQGPQFIAHGVNGSFVKYGIDPQEDALKQGQIPGTPGWGTEPENLWGKLNTEINGLHFEGKIETIPGNYLTFYENVFAAIRHGQDLLVKPEQALQVIQLIEAAIRSSEESQIVHL